MTGDISKFIKFLNDLNRGCHVRDIHDGLVYRLSDSGSINYCTHDHYIQYGGNAYWTTDTDRINVLMTAICTHSSVVVYDPNHQPVSQRQVRKVDL